MPRITNIDLRSGRTYVLILLAVGCIGWGLYALITEFRPAGSVHVRLAAGSPVARRFQIAECLANEASGCGVDMKVVATKGFEDSVRQVSEGKLETAAVSSGLQVSGCDDIRLLAGLDIAPLHVLVRRNLAETGLSLFEAVKGRRVNLGEAGTNDRLVASDLLSFLRLSPIGESGQGDYTEISMGKDELCHRAELLQSLTGQAREEQLQALPDVVMTVVSLPSVVVQKLLDTNEYCLVPFPHAQNFLMSSLESNHSSEGGVDRLYIEPTTIPAAMYLGSSPVPSSDCPTIGLRTILIARADLPSTTVKRLMQSVFETDFSRHIHPLSPREISTVYEIHPGAEAYLDRNQPLITGSFFENVSKFLSVFGAFSAGALSLYGYLRRRRIRRPGEYLEEIRKVDALASGQLFDGGAPATPEALTSHLDSRLVKLKEQLIHDYCNNRVQGEMVVMSILSMLADSRTHLHRSAGRSNAAETVATQDQSVEQVDRDVPVDNILRKPRRAA